MIKYGRNDDETVRLTAEALGMAEIDVRLMLAIVRGETTGDVVKVKDRPGTTRARRSEKKVNPPQRILKKRGKLQGKRTP